MFAKIEQRTSPFPSDWSQAPPQRLFAFIRYYCRGFYAPLVARVAGGIPPDFPKHPPEPVFWWSCRLWICLWPDSGSPFCPLTVAVDFDDAAINHGTFHIRLTADFRKGSGKAPCFALAAVTLEHAIPFAKFLG